MQYTENPKWFSKPQVAEDTCWNWHWCDKTVSKPTGNVIFVTGVINDVVFVQWQLARSDVTGSAEFRNPHTLLSPQSPHSIVTATTCMLQSDFQQDDLITFLV